MAPGHRLRKIRAAYRERMEELRSNTEKCLAELQSEEIEPGSPEAMFEQKLKNQLSSIKNAISELQPKSGGKPPADESGS
jgi:uncharacterized protein YyaL (SSP411 family)